MAVQEISMDAGWKFHIADKTTLSDAVAVTGWRWKQDDKHVIDAPSLGSQTFDTTGADWQVAAIGQDTFKGRVGFNWYRAVLSQVPGTHPMLHFTSVDDTADVYLNGVHLIHHEGWNDPFDVPLESEWKDDRPNVVTVLVENLTGPGGISGPVSLGNVLEAVAAVCGNF